MAEVFLAKLPGARGFEKELVVKRILPHLAEDAQYVDMFLAEAQLAARLSHPHLVQIFDFGEASGTYYIAMEYVDGVDLRSVLAAAALAKRRLDPAVCARLISIACEALTYVHDFEDPSTGLPLNLIHRDISPENILLSRQGVVKVVDFGIAKPTDVRGKTRAGLVKGKLAYMPPEQLRAQPLDRRVDVYALGVTLFELVAGDPPYHDPVETALMQAILDMPIPYIKLMRADAPGELQNVFDKVLAKDAAERYPSCRELQADLEAFIQSDAQGKPVTAKRLAELAATVPRTKVPVGPDAAPTERVGEPPKKSHLFSSQWEAPAYGLDSKGALQGKANIPRGTPDPTAYQPLRATQEKLEFAREIHKPKEGQLWKPHVRPRRRTDSLFLWALAVVILAGGALLGIRYFVALVPRGSFTLQTVDRPILLINSEPTATVIINGHKVGQTPWASENSFPPGQRIFVTLTRPGYSNWTGSFKGGQKVLLDGKLNRSR